MQLNQFDLKRRFAALDDRATREALAATRSEESSATREEAFHNRKMAQGWSWLGASNYLEKGPA